MSPAVVCAGIFVSEGGPGGISLGLCLGIPNAFCPRPGARRRLLRQLERGCFSLEERRLSISVEQGLKRFGAIQTLPRAFLWSKCCSDTCARGDGQRWLLGRDRDAPCPRPLSEAQTEENMGTTLSEGLGLGRNPLSTTRQILGLIYQVLASIHPLALAAP